MQGAGAQHALTLARGDCWSCGKFGLGTAWVKPALPQRVHRQATQKEPHGHFLPVPLHLSGRRMTDTVTDVQQPETL